MLPCTMCWKQISKVQKILLTILLYVTLYLVISYALTPEVKITLISDDLRIGDKYVIMFLVAPKSPVFSDSEGADVFRSRRCKKCFITNNKGFLPMSEYDAVLVYGEKKLLSESAAFMEPGKRYLIETDEICLLKKLTNCEKEPQVTSFSTKDSFKLCELCENLLSNRSIA